MVYRILVTNIQANESEEFSVLTNREHSEEDIKGLILNEISEYNDDDYYYEYIKL